MSLVLQLISFLTYRCDDVIIERTLEAGRSYESPHRHRGRFEKLKDGIGESEIKTRRVGNGSEVAGAGEEKLDRTKRRATRRHRGYAGEERLYHR